VGSIEEATARIAEKGGRVLQGKMPIPGMGWFATCEDTEGNKFGVFTNDPTAKM
jgi:predicted enzyme related to lactoylglutathione lyase